MNMSKKAKRRGESQRFSPMWVYADLWVRTTDTVTFEELRNPDAKLPRLCTAITYTSEELDKVADEGYKVIAVYLPPRKEPPSQETLLADLPF